MAKSVSTRKESSPRGVSVQLPKAKKLGPQVDLGVPKQHLSNRPMANRRVLGYLSRRVSGAVLALYFWAVTVS